MPLKKYPKNQTTNLVLIGFSGTGKTTIAKELEKHLGVPAFSIDSIIENQYGNIPYLFSRHGEGHFRELESRVLTEVMKNKTGIIDCGGGVVEREENMNLLKAWGTILWLNCPLKLIVQRTEGSSRPLLAGRSLQELQEFYQRRNMLYEKYHQYKIDTTKSLSQITNEILGIIRNE